MVGHLDKADCPLAAREDIRRNRLEDRPEDRLGRRLGTEVDLLDLLELLQVWMLTM